MLAWGGDGCDLVVTNVCDGGQRKNVQWVNTVGDIMVDRQPMTK